MRVHQQVCRDARASAGLQTCPYISRSVVIPMRVDPCRKAKRSNFGLAQLCGACLGLAEVALMWAVQRNCRQSRGPVAIRPCCVMT